MTLSTMYFVIIGPLIVENPLGANASMVEEMPCRSRKPQPSPAMRLWNATYIDGDVLSMAAKEY